MQDIKVTEESDPNQYLQEPQRRVCTVCAKQTSKYTCPKCGTPYCSLECYRNHSGKCVDKFHKENVDDFLKHQRVSQEEKNKMLRILKRVEEQRIGEEDAMMQNERNENVEDETSYTEEDEFFEKLGESEMDLNELTFDHLPKSVQDRFLRDLAAGKIKVESWVPWWHHISTINSSDSINKVKIEIISPEPEEENSIDPPPEVLAPIPALSSLISSKPSPLVAFNLINVLYAYAFSTRFFNGEMSQETLQYVAQLSDVLSGTAVFQNAKLAIQAAIENSMKPGIAVNTQFSISIVRDVAALLSTKSAVLAALSDLSRVAQSVSKETEKKQKRLLELMQKKLNFLLSWTIEQEDILFGNLQYIVLDDYLERKPQLSNNKINRN